MLAGKNIIEKTAHTFALIPRTREAGKKLSHDNGVNNEWPAEKSQHYGRLIGETRVGVVLLSEARRAQSRCVASPSTPSVEPPDTSTKNTSSMAGRNTLRTPYRSWPSPPFITLNTAALTNIPLTDVTVMLHNAARLSLSPAFLRAREVHRGGIVTCTKVGQGPHND